MPETPTAVDVARAIADVMERRRVPYAIGGALALGFYAPPRATVDVDVNLFVPPAEGFEATTAALHEAGFVPDGDWPSLRSRALTEGQFRGSISGIRVDVFVPSIPYYAELHDRRRQVILLERSIWILASEDLAVLKLMFFRRKDLADVEAIFRDQGSSIDRDFIRRKLLDLVGKGNERLAALDEIEKDVDTRP